MRTEALESTEQGAPKSMKSRASAQSMKSAKVSPCQLLCSHPQAAVSLIRLIRQTQQEADWAGKAPGAMDRHSNAGLRS